MYGMYCMYCFVFICLPLYPNPLIDRYLDNNHISQVTSHAFSGLTSLQTLYDDDDAAAAVVVVAVVIFYCWSFFCCY